jgi:hypothetical protein
MTLRGTVKRDFTPSLLETVAPRRRRARPSVDAARVLAYLPGSPPRVASRSRESALPTDRCSFARVRAPTGSQASAR